MQGPISVGDLVVFKRDKLQVLNGYILWSAPDYEPSSLEINEVIKPTNLLVVLEVKENDNSLVMTSTGKLGWTRTTLLRKCNEKT